MPKLHKQQESDEAKHEAEAFRQTSEKEITSQKNGIPLKIENVTVSNVNIGKVNVKPKTIVVKKAKPKVEVLQSSLTGVKNRPKLQAFEVVWKKNRIRNRELFSYKQCPQEEVRSKKLK